VPFSQVYAAGVKAASSSTGGIPDTMRLQPMAIFCATVAMGQQVAGRLLDG
jgi:hypothetical protein